MTRYRAGTIERVQAAQSAQARVTGVSQIQERHALPSSDEFIAKHPDKFERLPDYGNMFPFDPLVGVPHG